MNKLRYLTDAAMTTAIVALVLLVSELTGAELEELFPFLFAIPVAVYTMIYGIQKGWIPGLAITCICLFHDPLHALFFILTANLVGMLYGETVYKKWPMWTRYLSSIGGCVIINLLTLVVFSKLLFGYTIIEDTQTIANSITNTLGKWGANSYFVSLVDAFCLGIIPGTVIVMSFVEGICIHIFTSFLGNRLLKIEGINILTGLELSMPRWATFILIPFFVGGFVLSFWLPMFIGFVRVLTIILLNLSIVIGIIYLVEGLLYTQVKCSLEHKKALYVLACVSIIVFPLILIVIGMIDSIGKLRAKYTIVNTEKNGE